MSFCSQCNATFACGMVDTKSVKTKPTETCWCTALPTAPISNIVRDANGNAKTCMCPDCLAALRTRRLLEKDNSGPN